MEEEKKSKKICVRITDKLFNSVLEMSDTEKISTSQIIRASIKQMFKKKAEEK
jgi:hypothetical protein